MSVESTHQVMMRYFNAEHSDTSMLADDVVFTVMGTGEEHKGPKEIMQMLDYFYHVAFDATGEMTNLVIADGQAVWEGTLVGKHSGDFAGVPATNRDVRVPLCVVYDLENEQIKRGRIYFEMPAFMSQLGV
jgi:steroid delta-isomerase-like uncharacterized protein